MFQSLSSVQFKQQIVCLKTKTTSLLLYRRRHFSSSILNDLNNLQWKHANLPIESCYTPPNSWYTNKTFYEEIEKKYTFPNAWILVGHTKDLLNEGDYIAGNLLGNNPWVIVNAGIKKDDLNNDKDNNIHSKNFILKAYHNVCRHHAAQIVNDSIGSLIMDKDTLSNHHSNITKNIVANDTFVSTTDPTNNHPDTLIHPTSISSSSTTTTSTPSTPPCSKIPPLSNHSVVDNSITDTTMTPTLTHHHQQLKKEMKSSIRFRCPYHGWQYTLEGKLAKATRMQGSVCFKASENGLHPILVDHIGPWIFIRLNATGSKGGLLADQPDMATFFNYLSAGADNSSNNNNDNSSNNNSSNDSSCNNNSSYSNNNNNNSSNNNNNSSSKDNDNNSDNSNNNSNSNSSNSSTTTTGNTTFTTNNIDDKININDNNINNNSNNNNINNLVHIHSKSYTLDCNYKVFLDNYLDGGYHVAVAHPELAESLNMKTYKNIGGFENFFLQTCESKQPLSSSSSSQQPSSSSSQQPSSSSSSSSSQQPSSSASSSSAAATAEVSSSAAASSLSSAAATAEVSAAAAKAEVSSLPSSSSSSIPFNRLSGSSSDTHADAKPAVYLFHYPNLCINRYGQWMDVNRVFPTGIDTCIVHFDWYVDKSRLNDSEYLAHCLAESERVQLEDMWLCERVQKGLQSPVFEKVGGVYAPSLETGAYMYHQRLHSDYLMATLNASSSSTITS